MSTTDLAPRTEGEPGPGPASAPDRPAPRGRTPLKRSTKVALIVIATVSLLEALALAGTYLLYSRHYVTTDNAQVDGDQIRINAPTTGTVIDWSISAGSTVRGNQVVGRIQGVGGGAQPKRPVRSPGAGTIAVNTVADGQYVTAGTTLATAYDASSTYVTARVEEADIGGVRPGQLVDISVDAYPRARVRGMVTHIQGAAAGEFAVFPGSDTDPTNPQKVDQYIPVRIEITDSDAARLLPGMSVVAKIHRS
jgi:multidrug resistance efflux pump